MISGFLIFVIIQMSLTEIIFMSSGVFGVAPFSVYIFVKIQWITHLK